MIGQVGGILGRADINISTMHLGRSAPRSDAVMILSLDDPVPPSVAAAIRAVDGITDLRVIEFGLDA